MRQSASAKRMRPAPVMAARKTNCVAATVTPYMDFDTTLATTAAQFNLDPHAVLGRTRDLELIGVGRTPMEGDLARIATAQGLRVVPEENTEAGWYYRSDHYALAQKRVPGVYFRAGRDLVKGGLPAGERIRARYNAQ